MRRSCRHHLPCNCDRNASETIVNVKNHIKGCIQVYMSLEETMKCLQITQQIDPQITKTVWEDLERKNPDFFKVYNVSVETFTRLLEPQAALMQEHGQVDLTILPPAINEFLRQDPAGTRFLQNDVLTSAANRPSNQLQIRNDQQPQPQNQFDLLRQQQRQANQLQMRNDQQPQHRNQLRTRLLRNLANIPCFVVNQLLSPNNQQPQHHNQSSTPRDSAFKEDDSKPA